MPTSLPLYINYRKLCHICVIPIKRQKQKFYCIDCEDVVKWYQGKAIGVIHNMVKSGKLPAASTLQCSDCGQQAHVWEHRGYLRQFGLKAKDSAAIKVVPCCRSCNIKRGPATDLWHESLNPATPESHGCSVHEMGGYWKECEYL